MNGLAYLTLILLINHRIPHVPLDFSECRFYLKMEGNHTLFGQGANTDQSDIPTHGSKCHQRRNLA